MEIGILSQIGVYPYSGLPSSSPVAIIKYLHTSEDYSKTYSSFFRAPSKPTICTPGENLGIKKALWNCVGYIWNWMNTAILASTPDVKQGVRVG